MDLFVSSAADRHGGFRRQLSIPQFLILRECTDRGEILGWNEVFWGSLIFAFSDFQNSVQRIQTGCCLSRIYALWYSDVITKVVQVVNPFLILTPSRNFLCEVVSIPVVTGLVVACPNLIFSSLVCVRAMVRFGQAKGMFCNGGKCRQITIVKYRGESRDKKITAAKLVFSPSTCT